VAKELKSYLQLLISTIILSLFSSDVIVVSILESFGPIQGMVQRMLILLFKLAFAFLSLIEPQLESSTSTY
jgi:hypothetical protein